jgi:polyhydroxyalkanoate synthesis regulator phasin
MEDNIGKAIKKVLYTGVGLAAVAANTTVKIVGTLEQKGEEAIQKSKEMTEDLKRKKAEAKSNLSSLMDSLEKLTKDELEAIRERLSSMEETFDEAKDSVKMGVDEILSSLEKLGKDEITSIKTKIEEIRKEAFEVEDDTNP